jgi:hypothetical protein
LCKPAFRKCNRSGKGKFTAKRSRSGQGVKFE